MKNYKILVLVLGLLGVRGEDDGGQGNVDDDLNLDIQMCDDRPQGEDDDVSDHLPGVRGEDYGSQAHVEDDNVSDHLPGEDDNPDDTKIEEEQQGIANKIMFKS